MTHLTYFLSAYLMFLSVIISNGQCGTNDSDNDFGSCSSFDDDNYYEPYILTHEDSLRLRKNHYYTSSEVSFQVENFQFNQIIQANDINPNFSRPSLTSIKAGILNFSFGKNGQYHIEPLVFSISTNSTSTDNTLPLSMYRFGSSFGFQVVNGIKNKLYLSTGVFGSFNHLKYNSFMQSMVDAELLEPKTEGLNDLRFSRTYLSLNPSLKYIKYFSVSPKMGKLFVGLELGKYINLSRNNEWELGGYDDCGCYHEIDRVELFTRQRISSSYLSVLLGIAIY